MDWGGLIAGAMGGGAQAVGQVADNAIQQRDAEAAGVRAEQRAIEGERRRSLLNREEAAYAADQKLKGEEARMERYAKSADEVDAKAKEIKDGRDLGGLTTTQSGIAGDSPNASPEELKALLADPKNRKIYEDAGYIKKTTGSGLILDKIEASREVGADPALRTDLKADYKTQLGAEQTAESNNFKEREAYRRDKADENKFQTSFMQAQASLQQAAAANKRAEKSGDAAVKAEQQTNLNTTISTNMKLVEEATKRLQIMDDSDPQRKSLQERIDRANALIDDAQKGLGGRISGEIDKRKSTPEKSAVKTATAADIEATARASGRSVEEVKKAMKAKGYTIQ